MNWLKKGDCNSLNIFNMSSHFANFEKNITTKIHFCEQKIKY